MRSILYLCLVLFSGLSWGKTPRHMVMINQTGVGGFSSYEHFSPRSGSLFEKYEVFEGNVEANYTYTLDNRWQIGAFFSNHNQTRTIETTYGPEGKIQTDLQVLGAHLLYNFSDELRSSWLVGGALSYINQEEEYDKDIQDFLEDDRQAVSIEAIIGKRFQLPMKGLESLSYSPALTLFIMNSTKDYADDKINYSYGFKIHFLKFDLLF